jgi:hypothetical protein
VLQEWNFKSFKFLGAFAKLRKGSIRFVTSIRPSVCMEHLGSHWTDCHDFFFKSVEKIQISLKADENNGYFT